ncbi:hypothetical protein ACIBI3_01490 [Actinomadura luteofluorescens]|uniref:hypothetical protein n=1 Tax=Actinomadura luteofluorescens TaxID=46163 RepID=UPI00348AFEA0
MKVNSPDASSGSNSRFPWDNFDPEKYRENNYKKLRADDAQILGRGVDWFSQVALWRYSGGKGRFSHGIDVGPGSNLYPTLSMLGYCRKITLFEYGAANVQYLRGEIEHLSDSWKPFWDVVSPSVGNRDFEWARRALKKRATVVQGDIFKDLPKGEFDIGTMHFVAESLTADPREVRYGVRNFTRSLVTESPFVMANVQGSNGYFVGDQWFPAAPVTPTDVEWMLDLLADHKKVEHIDIDGPSIHLNAEGKPEDDYAGYVVSMGLSY